MGTTHRSRTHIIESITRRPHLFDLYQVVRLLELEDKTHAATKRHYDPRYEFIRFKTATTLSFPLHDIVEATRESVNASKTTLYTNALSLIGATGTLPHHDTEKLLKNKKDKNNALEDFMNIFHHRLNILLYRAWQKNHLLFQLEAFNHGIQEHDNLRSILRSSIGINNTHLTNKTDIDDDSLFYYSGLLSHKNKSSNGLAILLSHFFKLPISVKPFQGQWLSISNSEQTQLTYRGNCCNTLGEQTYLGEKIWSLQHQFSIHIGPLSYQQFRQCLPNNGLLKILINLTRRYIPIDLSFTISLELKAEEIPYCQLRSNNPLLLGWNTWLKNKASEQNVFDVVLGEYHALTQTIYGSAH